MRALISLIVIGSAVLWAGPLSAQIGPLRHREAASPGAARTRAAPGVQALTEGRHGNPPSGRWGGPGCAKESDLIAMVDHYLSTASPDFPELGSPIAGASMAWRSRECGSFTYVAGLRNVEKGLPMTPAAR